MNAYHQSNMYCNRAVAIPRDEFVLVQLWAAEMGWGALGWLIWDRREEGAHDPYKISLQLSHGLLLLEERSTGIGARKVHVSEYNSLWFNHGLVLLASVNISAWILLLSTTNITKSTTHQQSIRTSKNRGIAMGRVLIRSTEAKRN